MEFDELQKIWDAQNNQSLYAINEQALHNRILAKMKKGNQISNISELLLIIVNLGAGSFIVVLDFFQAGGNIFMNIVAIWMFATALYLLSSRIRRRKAGRNFNRSMHGDLRHAISTATYQVRLSQIMRWNTLPIATLVFVALWDSGKPLWTFGLILMFFILAIFAGNWEHRFYKARKRGLEILQDKLEAKE